MFNRATNLLCAWCICCSLHWFTGNELFYLGTDLDDLGPQRWGSSLSTNTF